MKRLTFLLFCLLLGIGMANAQTTKVTGTVISAEDNEPIIGASIVVKGTTIGTVTDFNGAFSLDVPSSAKTLVVSFVGMKSQEIGIKPTLHVVLAADNQMLDEVMVVAYGTAKKSSFTGAASSVNAEKVLKDVPVTSFEQALQGATTGLTVNSSSGQPGAGLSIRIRGTGSMNATNEPLYVIDGVPVISGDIAVSGVSNDSKAFNIMSSINPSDIENITVLKDAAAASLYGSRAANGVILITTKRGKEGKTQINFKANWGFSDWAVKNRETVSGEQQHELTYEAYYNEGILYKDMSEEEARVYAQEGADTFAPLRDHYSNWEDALFKKSAFNQNYEFSAQGGSELTNFFASLNYKTEDGMINTTGMEGFTGRVNVTHKSKDGKMQMGANISFSKQKSEMASEGTAYANAYFVKNWYAIPNLPIYNEDGSFYEGFPLDQLNVPNPLRDQGLDKNTSEVLRSTNSLWASYKIIEGLTIKETISYDFIDNQSTTYWPMNSNNGEAYNGLMIKYPYQHHNIYSSTVLNYTNTFADKHNLDVLLGWDVDDRKEQFVQAVGANYPHDKLPELGNTSEPMTASSGYSEDHLLSLLSRINYDYDDKYYISANYRRDGSSRLGANTRWGNFWSVSAAWRLSQEAFMKNLTYVDDLKLRVSYGINGTLPSKFYSHLSLFGYGFNYQDQPGSAPTTIPNPDLGWEKNENFNIGFDARLFGRLSVAFDFYNRETKDLLQDVPLLSRINYDYDDKYYISANYRRDGSSRLGANTRWGNFWSVSAAWRLSQEAFMKNLTYVDDLKLRVSYGINGTLPSKFYSHLSLFGYGFNYQDQPGSAPTTIPNPDLGWEKNENFNIGFDARLFGRLSVAFDFYNRETKDLLQDVPVSMTTGFNNTLKNVGAMNNRGIELDMNYDVFNETAVKWSTGIVLSHNKNKISKLYGGKDIISGTSILREGESYYSWWSREWAGVDPQTGEEQWVLNTENEDGTINRGLTKDPSQAQRVIIGKPDPKVTGGWRNNLSWKGLDLSALFSFSLGGHIMDDPALLYTDTDGETAYQSIGIQQLDRWQKPGDITDVPRRINSYQYARYGSSRHMKSSNHLRLKTVTLSYNLPSKWMQAAGMRNVRIFASGNNLLTWAAYKNIDPEQPVNGVATWALPNLKSVTFGIEIGL